MALIIRNNIIRNIGFIRNNITSIKDKFGFVRSLFIVVMNIKWNVYMSYDCLELFYLYLYLPRSCKKK